MKYIVKYFEPLSELSLSSTMTKYLSYIAEKILDHEKKIFKFAILSNFINKWDYNPSLYFEINIKNK